jgi:hypothetical protein
MIAGFRLLIADWIVDLPIADLSNVLIPQSANKSAIRDRKSAIQDPH